MPLAIQGGEHVVTPPVTLGPVGPTTLTRQPGMCGFPLTRVCGVVPMPARVPAA